MKGGFDLYGNYYPNVNDAINAEISQCNEIDNRNNRREIDQLKKRVQQQHPDPLQDEIANLWQHIKSLQDQINKLTNTPNP